MCPNNDLKKSGVTDLGLYSGITVHDVKTGSSVGAQRAHFRTITFRPEPTILRPSHSQPPPTK